MLQHLPLTHLIWIVYELSLQNHKANSLVGFMSALIDYTILFYWLVTYSLIKHYKITNLISV